MTSQRTWNRTIGVVVLFVLMLALGISLISASPAEATEAVQTSEQTQIEELTRQIQELSQLVNQISTREEFILVLSINQEAFGGTATLQRTVLQISVDRDFFDSCSIGDDITESSQIRLLSSSLLTDTRIYVDDKFIINR